MLKCMTTFPNMHSLLQWSSAGVSLAAPKLGETALWEFRPDAERELWEKVYSLLQCHGLLCFPVYNN